MPDLPDDPPPVAPGAAPASGDVEPDGVGPGDDAPPPRDVSGLIGPTLVGMVGGVAVVLLILWLT